MTAPTDDLMCEICGFTADDEDELIIHREDCEIENEVWT